MLRNILDKNANGIKEWLQKGDISILDRGFRDTLNSLEDDGFETKSPSFLPKAEKRLPTSDANQSSLVTEILRAVECVNDRRAVECVNGRRAIECVNGRRAVACVNGRIMCTTSKVYN